MNFFSCGIDEESEDREEYSQLFDLGNALFCQPHQTTLKIDKKSGENTSKNQRPVSKACLTHQSPTITIAPSDCNTTLGTVTRRRHLTSLSPRTSLVRALSLLLLVFILYGTTIEAAHRHGRLLKRDGSEQSLTVSHPSIPTNVAGGQFGCSECLICQLQKTFSATLVTVRAVSSRPRSRLELLLPPAIAFKSQTNAPQKGRAPPFTS